MRIRSSCRKFTNVNLIKIIIIFMSDTIIIIIIVIIIIIIIMISSTFINANSIKSAEVKVVDSPQWLMNRTASAKYSPVESLFWCTVSPLAFIDSKIWCNFSWLFLRCLMIFLAFYQLLFQSILLIASLKILANCWNVQKNCTFLTRWLP